MLVVGEVWILTSPPKFIPQPYWPDPTLKTHQGEDPTTGVTVASEEQFNVLLILSIDAEVVAILAK